MSNEQQDKIELTVKIPFSKEASPIEAVLEFIAQISTFTSNMATYHDGEIENFDSTDLKDLFYDTLSCELWKSVTRSNAAIGLALCSKSPNPITELNQLLTNFIKKQEGNNDSKNKNKKEKIETFLKENPDLN